MIKPIKFGVIGVGYLGNFHAQQLKRVQNAHLVGVFDLNSNLCIKTAEKYNELKTQIYKTKIVQIIVFAKLLVIISEI